MIVPTTLQTLAFDQALEHVREEGAAFVDLRPIDSYLEVHLPGSLELLYEFGPGMAARARDCLPLSLPLVLLELGSGDVLHAAASLRGKGFTVLGKVDDAINRWTEECGPPASTDVIEGPDRPKGTILDVVDPGAVVPEPTHRIPLELLWKRVDEIDLRARLVVAAGFGVRAALAVGILERAGAEQVVFWRVKG